ncbi:MAG: hypothetical protein CXR31_13795 [Geobacter sp.]|nr:MAG: hypothetical protein CXR31_13795 [Geobacter sp.]
MCKMAFIAAMFCIAPIVAFADGRTDYNAHCAGCHGAHGNVQTEKAKALHMDVRKLALNVSKKNKSEVIAVIRSGKGKMPGYAGELTGEQISLIADYVIALRKK